MKNIVIVGATSAIAIACAREWAAKGARFFLVARNQERMEQVAADLLKRVGIGTRVKMTFTDIAPGLAIPQWTVDGTATAKPWRYPG